jgi:hypothetical protein
MLKRRPYPITPASDRHSFVLSFLRSHLSTPSILHAVPYTSPHLPLEFFLILPPKLAGLDVGGTFVVWASEHTDDRYKDCLGRKDR